ncbi:MAG: CPBP family intramembrane glutamic endopeptidase [Dokdonella sp.]
MNTKTGKISLRKQFITCAVLCASAAVIILLFHRKPYFSALLLGLSLPNQILLGTAVGMLYWVVSLLGYKFVVDRRATRTIAESYSRLDLRGLNPLGFAVAAGFGEELLFRGALQPLLGIWVTSALFVLVHIRAYQLDKLDKRVLFQSTSIFAISVVLGYVAAYAGLVTAMIVHAAMDTVGLYAVRRLTQVAETAAT